MAHPARLLLPRTARRGALRKIGRNLTEAKSLGGDDVSFIFCLFDHLRRTNGAVPCADNLVHRMRVCLSPRALLSCSQAIERHRRAGNADASAGVCGAAGRQLLAVGGLGASADYTMGYRYVACRVCAILHLVLHPSTRQNPRGKDVRNPTRVCGTRKSDWNESCAEDLALKKFSELPRRSARAPTPRSDTPRCFRGSDAATIGVEQTKRDLSRRDLDARQRKDVGGVEESSLPRLRPRGLVLAQ
jgi:hypothetical protein